MMDPQHTISSLFEEPADCFIDPEHPARKDPKHWVIGPVIRHRDSGLLDQSNAAALEQSLRENKELNGDWELYRFSHWAVGWVDHLSFRALGEDDKPTEMTKFLTQWYQNLHDYAVADEDDYSIREYEAALENIRWEATGMLKAEGIPDDWDQEVFTWLSDNIPQALDNVDDRGAYPSREELTKALTALGYMTVENDA